MQTPPVRTITLGIGDRHPLSAEVIRRSADLLQQAQSHFAEAGYEVQTVRLSTRPVFDDLADWSADALLRYARDLQAMLDDVGLVYCSLGTALAARPDFPLERIEPLADLLAATTALNTTVQVAAPEYGMRAAAALATARVMKRLAHETDEGFGNFRFAMLACVEPGSPFFPAAYHSGPSSLVIGLQGAGVVVDAIRKLLAVEGRQGEQGRDAPLELQRVTETVRAALGEQATPVVRLAEQLAREFGLQFGGIDLSPAPMGEDSIVAALELCGYGRIGSAGTLAVAAALTAGLKSVALPACGYCGLMLPVLEDAVLGKRWAEGLISTHELLLYSAVCGTGLDTIPLAGNIEAEAIAALLLDVAALALRLRKPLSARLFPVPGKKVGDFTAFTSPYLTNTLVR